ncbi:MAG TPA: LacI family DNA-binding transcriptional regulator [Chloroflexota bacterium]|nr:LacI family DNA-binding transcriptional regulator [Chloroflexota bacterium]
MVDSQDGNGRRAARTTIRDVAADLGVSVATVSRVLNGRPDVSPATREAVLRHMRERGYSGNRTARGLAGGRTGLIGLALPFVHAAYFGLISAGAAEALAECDARLVLCLTEHQHDREVTLLDRMMHGTTDGGLILLPSETSAELIQLREQGYHFVIIDPMVPLDESLPVVSAAHWQGARMATEHLIALGHRRIGVITGHPTWVASIERLAGFQAAMASAGLRVQPELIYHGDWYVEAGVAGANYLLDLPDPPTAIFAFNDNMAIGVMQVARQRGLRLPRDLSVVGVDDIDMAACLTPPLTTVRQPLLEMGRVAAGLLWRLIQGQPVEITRLELATRLIVRDSTAPPPASTRSRG